MNTSYSAKSFIAGLLGALVVTMFVGLFYQNAVGQTNQVESAVANANLTSANFNEITNNLIIARQGILNNDSVSAYGAINAVGSNLFSLTQDATGGNETLIKQLNGELRPIQAGIELARDGLRDINSTQALRGLNYADLQLLNITQGLPPGEELDTAE